ncbi:MAG: class I SAM-dependent RNA methyltransferase, partial [Rhizobiaceae bacterium]
LLREGITYQVEPVMAFGPAARRRVVFPARSTANGVNFGFLQRDSELIIDIDQCPVLIDEITGNLSEIRDLAAILCDRKGNSKITVLAFDNGLDVAIETRPSPGNSSVIRAIEFAGLHSFARLCLNGEILIETRRPYLSCGPANVTPPPGGFVQAVAAAENSMARLVCDHFSDCSSVADLFCGHGAFALRLAEQSTVYAAESSETAIEALDQAWRGTGGKLKQIVTEKRDLYRRPMSTAEMKKISGVVFDPPRAGAIEQARHLALSNVSKIAAVSCNPVTLARDLAILIDGGYNLMSVSPIDQFIYTPHVEAVALLER